jgi:hypothetical protein
VKVSKNAAGLYVFPIHVTVPKSDKTKVFNGMVDTGSTICASTYKIITTLRAKPTSHKPIKNPMGPPKPTIGYSIGFGFDGKSVMTNVYRLPLDLPGIDFILGTPVLDQCKVSFSGDTMEIVWK